MRKSIGALAIVLFSATSILAQAYPKYTAYRIKSEKKYTHYQRQAKQHEKQQHYRRAALNALKALDTTEKKKQIEKAKELVSNTYPLAISKSEQAIQQLQAATNTDDLDRKAALFYEISRIYSELNQTVLNYQQLSTDKKVGDWRAELYSDEVVQAKKDLNAAQTAAAAFHYQNALALPANDHWEVRLAKARALKMAHHYDADYQDVKSLFAAARSTGQVKIQLHRIENRSTQPALSELDFSAENEVSNALRREKFSFVRLATPGERSDVVVNMTIEGVSFSRPSISKTTSERKKIIDKKKEDVARATLTTFEQHIGATINYRFTITDIESGDQLNSENGSLDNVYVYSDYWYQATGDKRALSKSEQKDIQTDNRAEPIPPSTELFSEALTMLRSNLAGHVVDFSTLIGY